MKEYSYDYEWDEEYCYPQSKVLLNQLNITDAEHLSEAEREITALKAAKAIDVPLKGSLDLKHLQSIHRYLFGEIYDWAGKLRHVNISKGNQFCLAQNLDLYAADLFRKLEEEQYLLKTPQEELPVRLAYYLSEINVLHPFREGNGRAQRIFIQYLAHAAGYEVSFAEVSQREMIIASAESFACDYTSINEMFRNITKPTSHDEQRTFLHAMTGERGPVWTAYNRITR